MAIRSRSNRGSSHDVRISWNPSLLRDCRRVSHEGDRGINITLPSQSPGPPGLPRGSCTGEWNTLKRTVYTRRGNENVTRGYAPNEGSTNRVATVNGSVEAARVNPEWAKADSPSSSLQLSFSCALLFSSGWKRVRRRERTNKWVRWVTARRKSRANGCLNAKPAGSLSRTHPPPSARPRNLIIQLMGPRAVAYYSYISRPLDPNDRPWRGEARGSSRGSHLNRFGRARSNRGGTRAGEKVFLRMF